MVGRGRLKPLQNKDPVSPATPIFPGDCVGRLNPMKHKASVSPGGAPAARRAPGFGRLHWPVGASCSGTDVEHILDLRAVTVFGALYFVGGRFTNRPSAMRVSITRATSSLLALKGPSLPDFKSAKPGL